MNDKQGPCPYAGKWYMLSTQDVIFIHGWYGTNYIHSVCGNYSTDRKFDMERVFDAMSISRPQELTREQVTALGIDPDRFNTSGL